MTNKKSAATIISSFSYTHDKVGNRLTMTAPEGTHTYSYDNIYRLTSADHPVSPDEAYTYDNVGNRKASSLYNNWAYDANNRLLSFNGTNFTYDNNGNTITKTKAAQTTTYSYDPENRLSNISGTANASYSYDALGKRLSKTVDGVAKYYLYDNEDIIAEYDSAGSLTASYVHGQGIDEPIKGLSPTGTVPEWYYTFDGLGSISELTDSSQNIVESYKYDAFGNLETPPATGNPYTYTGREYDLESGLYYYRARYYDPNIGRFITADPIGFNGGVNFYAYVENNPINRVDPFGKEGGVQCELERKECLNRVNKNFFRCVMGKIPYMDIPVCILGCVGLCARTVGPGPQFMACWSTCFSVCGFAFAMHTWNKAVESCLKEAKRENDKCWDNYWSCPCY